jgi:hypothetical protein
MCSAYPVGSAWSGCTQARGGRQPRSPAEVVDLVRHIAALSRPGLRSGAACPGAPGVTRPRTPACPNALHVHPSRDPNVPRTITRSRRGPWSVKCSVVTNATAAGRGSFAPSPPPVASPAATPPFSSRSKLESLRSRRHRDAPSKRELGSGQASHWPPARRVRRSRPRPHLQRRPPRERCTDALRRAPRWAPVTAAVDPSTIISRTHLLAHRPADDQDSTG